VSSAVPLRHTLTVPIRRRPAAGLVTPSQPSTPVTLEVAAVARRLGVATGTLRTWDRRYGLGPSGHQAGTRRRYTAADLARLTLMHRLMLQGVGAAEAARAATETDVDQLPGADEPLPPEPPVAGPRGRRARPGGGRVLATREAGPAARGLARAAMSLDSDACTALLRTSLAKSGVVGTWNDVLLPVLAGVGDRWRTTGRASRSSTCSASAPRRRSGGSPTRPARLATPARCCWPRWSPRTTGCRWSRSPPPWPSAGSPPGRSAPGCRPGRWSTRCPAPVLSRCSSGPRAPPGRAGCRTRTRSRPSGPRPSCCWAAPAGTRSGAGPA
jgi:DNA-binding transcriptional MerR regulator